jgi:hypothetical protein
MIFMVGPLLLVRLALLAGLREADYRSTLFEFLREDHP